MPPGPTPIRPSEVGAYLIPRIRATIDGVVRTTDYVGGLFERVQTGGTTEYRHKVFADGREVMTYVRRGMADGTYQAEMQELEPLSALSSSGSVLARATAEHSDRTSRFQYAGGGFASKGWNLYSADRKSDPATFQSMVTR